MHFPTTTYPEFFLALGGPAFALLAFVSPRHRHAKAYAALAVIGAAVPIIAGGLLSYVHYRVQLAAAPSVAFGFAMTRESVASAASAAAPIAARGLVVGAVALLAAFVAVARVARAQRGSSLIAVTLLGTALVAASAVPAWRMNTYEARVDGTALSIQFAGAYNCHDLEFALDHVAANTMRPVVHDFDARARECVAARLSSLDDPKQRSELRMKIDLAKATGQDASGMTDDPLLALSRSPLLVDAAQKTEVQRLLAQTAL